MQVNGRDIRASGLSRRRSDEGSENVNEIFDQKPKKMFVHSFVAVLTILALCLPLLAIHCWVGAWQWRI